MLSGSNDGVDVFQRTFQKQNNIKQMHTNIVIAQENPNAFGCSAPGISTLESSPGIPLN